MENEIDANVLEECAKNPNYRSVLNDFIRMRKHFIVEKSAYRVVHRVLRQISDGDGTNWLYSPFHGNYSLLSWSDHASTFFVCANGILIVVYYSVCGRFQSSKVPLSGAAVGIIGSFLVWTCRFIACQHTRRLFQIIPIVGFTLLGVYDNGTRLWLTFAHAVLYTLIFSGQRVGFIWSFLLPEIDQGFYRLMMDTNLVASYFNIIVAIVYIFFLAFDF